MNFQTIQAILNRLQIDEDICREIEAILKRVRILKDKGCWVVSRDWSNYARHKGKPLHRFMYRVFTGEIKEKSLICHHCDRPGCINPKHLFQGTATDNYKDAVKKGRAVPFDFLFHKPDKELQKLKKIQEWLQLWRHL